MNERNEQEKKSLRQRLAHRYGEASMRRGGDTVVLHGVSGATVYGCRRIVYYSPREICLELDGRRVSVCGEGLFCASFTAGTVAVRGQVSGARYHGGGEVVGADAL